MGRETMGRRKADQMMDITRLYIEAGARSQST
jgi:hypothetical protein